MAIKTEVWVNTQNGFPKVDKCSQVWHTHARSVNLKTYSQIGGKGTLTTALERIFGVVCDWNKCGVGRGDKVPGY